MNYYDIQPALNYGYYQPDPENSWEQAYDAPGPKAVRQEIKNIISFGLIKESTVFVATWPGHW